MKKKEKYPVVENSFYERIIVEINVCRKRVRDLRALGNRTCNANWSGDAHAEAHARLVQVCHEQACVDVLCGVLMLEMRRPPRRNYFRNASSAAFFRISTRG